MGERCKLPQPRSNLVHYSCNIWDLVATIFNISLNRKINLLNLMLMSCLGNWGEGVRLDPLGPTPCLRHCRQVWNHNFNTVLRSIPRLHVSWSSLLLLLLSCVFSTSALTSSLTSLQVNYCMRDDGTLVASFSSQQKSLNLIFAVGMRKQ